jgi:hypothetical protein
VIEMSDDRIRESREVQGQQISPAAKTTAAPAAGDVTQQPLNPPSGVRVPAVTYTVGTQPLAALTAAEEPAEAK